MKQTGCCLPAILQQPLTSFKWAAHEQYHTGASFQFPVGINTLIQFFACFFVAAAAIDFFQTGGSQTIKALGIFTPP